MTGVLWLPVQLTITSKLLLYTNITANALQQALTAPSRHWPPDPVD